MPALAAIPTTCWHASGLHIHLSLLVLNQVVDDLKNSMSSAPAVICQVIKLVSCCLSTMYEMIAISKLEIATA